jgi:hypothetical protein
MKQSSRSMSSNRKTTLNPPEFCEICGGVLVVEDLDTLVCPYCMTTFSAVDDDDFEDFLNLF